MNSSIQNTLAGIIQNALAEAGVKEKIEFSVERPSIAEHGDWACNAALVAAAKVSKAPLDLANSLADILNRDQPAHIKRVEAVKPGFLNIYLKDDWLYEVLAQILEQGQKGFARHSFGQGQKALVEFVSANPTGPLHAGHAKGAVFGDTLARILDRCGYEVTREFYLNDLGAQVDLFAASLSARLEGKQPPTDGYMGKYVEEWAGELGKSGEKDYKSWGLKKAQSCQAEVLRSLDIEFDIWFGESSVYESGGIEKVLTELRAKEMVYEKDGALWLKASEYGDNKDRVLIKSDGSLTYLLPDIAYHLDKLSRSDRVINIWGADHHGYVERMRAALSGLGQDLSRLDIIICQLVRLESEGEEIRISKRTGDIILLEDLVQELGSDAVRFTFLLQSADSAQTVDLQKASAASMDNPVYYVQYAHTRICSIIEKVETETGRKIYEEAVDFSLLAHPSELETLRILAEMPELIFQAAHHLAPHKLTVYLRELASAFHNFYHNCRVTGEGISRELTVARLNFLLAVRIGLSIGLDLCGVGAPKKM